MTIKWSKKTELERPISIKKLLAVLPDAEAQVDTRFSYFKRFRPLEYADKESLSFCAYRKGIATVDLANKSDAAVIICDKQLVDKIKKNKTLISVLDAKLAFSLVVSYFVDLYDSKVGPYKTCMTTKNSYIHETAYIGPNVVFGDRITIGANTIVQANSVIYSDTIIGTNTIISSGCSVGHSGLGLVMNKANQEWLHFSDIGNVDIGNNVYIGPNCCIARAPISSTIIEDGVKIAQLVNIGHNAHIKKNTVITSMAMVARGTIGERAWLAPSCVICPGVNIGENTLVGTGAVVVKSIRKNMKVVGNPAKPIGGSK